jgi:hypothetical protein
MFGWFKRKKPEQKAESKKRDPVYVDQRGARASGDIVGGNKYSTRRESSPAYDPLTDPLSVMNPLSPVNTLMLSDDEPTKHSHDSGSSWSSSSHDSGSSYSSSSSSSD